MKHGATILVLCLLASAGRADEFTSAREREAERVAVAKRISRSTIAVLEPTGGNGGSGVIVSADGVALTNYHVVQPCGPAMLCGLSDGRVVEAVLLGADPAGDLAAIRLLEGGPFPPADWGSTRSTQIGDEVIVAGNPLLLADDFSPSISVGVLSGKHRYQYPSGDLLEYADCLQTDAPINPGNSGGPLFDGQGRLLGIVGRASFEKRGRVSVGVGYAISVEQARRFLPALAGGCVPDHGSLGFTVRSVSGRLAGGPRIDRIDDATAAAASGLRRGDEITQLGDREIASANDLQNAVGVLPAGWPVTITYRRDGVRGRVTLRLDQQHDPGRLGDEVRSSLAPPAAFLTDYASEYAPAEGLANLVANKRATQRVLDAYAPHAATSRDPAADSPSLSVTLTEAEVQADLTVSAAEIRWRSPRHDVRLLRGEPYASQASPGRPRSVLVGLAAWCDIHRTPGETVRYFGAAPWRPGQTPAAVLRHSDNDADTDFYFNRATGELIGWSTRVRHDGRLADFELADDASQTPGGRTVRLTAVSVQPETLVIRRAGP